jgi:carbamoyltransferase
MAYNILGINPYHNGSVCVLSDGEVVYYLEEERLTRSKYDANPFKVILETLTQFNIDEVVIAGINHHESTLSYTLEEPHLALIRKFHPKIPITFYSDKHHLLHFYHSYINSTFKNPLGVVVDAGGSSSGKFIEQASLFKLDLNLNPIKISNEDTMCPPSINEGLGIGLTYNLISNILGFDSNESGKTMGLSSYGKNNKIFPPLFKGTKTDPNLIKNINCKDEFLEFNKKIFFKNFNIDWHYSRQKCSQYEMDLAWMIQSNTQQALGDFIETGLKETGLKQVCCSGGVFLNCVANYYLIKRFPDIEFYFEPISHDGGTSMGAAYYKWKNRSLTNKIKPQNSLYYGDLPTPQKKY